MKRFILAALAVLAITFGATAQDDASLERHSVYMQAGMATPRGTFGTSSFEEDYPEFADIGVLLQGGYRYRISKFLAAGGSLAFRYNSFNMDALVEDSDNLVTGKDAKGWQSVMALADVYAFYPLPDEVTTLYAKAMAGASFNRSAAWHIDTPYGSIDMPADNAKAAAYGWAAGLMLNAKPVELYVEAGMLYTKPEFNVLNTTGEAFRHKQAMHTFNVSLGVSYSF